MIMDKYKILIIDDRCHERKLHFDAVLSDYFELFYVENPASIFNQIRDSKLGANVIDLYLVDIELSRWKNPRNGQSLYVTDVLDAIGVDNPIVLISSEYSKLLDEGKLTPLMNDIVESGFNVGLFLVWSDILNSSLSEDKSDVIAIRAKIELIIKKNIKAKSKFYHFGLICALQMEIKPFLDNSINIKKIQNIGNVPVYEGEIKLNDGNILNYIFTTQQDMGTTDCAIVTSFLAIQYKVKNIFMVGVCGGRSGHVKIGDIIIPSESIAYQRGKITENGLQSDIGVSHSNINLRGITENQSESILTAIFQEYANHLTQAGSLISITKPTIHYNELACGDNVIDKEGLLDQIAGKAAQRKLCGIDMESYAILRSNMLLDIKSAVIKSVMDLTSDKNDNYKEYAAFVSANFLFKILYNRILSLD